MANTIFINDAGIIECQVDGNQTLESVTVMGEEIKKLLGELKTQQRPLLILDDITKIGQVDAAGRSAVIQLVKSLEYDRLVMLGNNGLIRLGANLIFRASGRSQKTKYFIDRAQAISWLQNG